MIELRIIYKSNPDFETTKYFETGKELQAFIRHKKLTYPGTRLGGFFGRTLIVNG